MESTMNQFFRATAALALLAASLPALAASATVARAFTFKPASNAGLKVQNLVGDVRVERGAGPGIEVAATTTVEAATEDEAKRLAGLVDFRSKDVGPGSRFDVRLPPEHFPKVYWQDGASHWWAVSYVQSPILVRIGSTLSLGSPMPKFPNSAQIWPPFSPLAIVRKGASKRSKKPPPWKLKSLPLAPTITVRCCCISKMMPEV